MNKENEIVEMKQIFRGLSYFADAKLDPEDVYKNAAIEYIEDVGCDRNDAFSLIELASSVDDKIDDLVEQLKQHPRKEEEEFLNNLRMDYLKISCGLMHIIFNGLECLDINMTKENI